MSELLNMEMLLTAKKRAEERIVSVCIEENEVNERLTPLFRRSKTLASNERETFEADQERRNRLYCEKSALESFLDATRFLIDGMPFGGQVGWYLITRLLTETVAPCDAYRQGDETRVIAFAACRGTPDLAASVLTPCRNCRVPACVVGKNGSHPMFDNEERTTMLFTLCFACQRSRCIFAGSYNRNFAHLGEDWPTLRSYHEQIDVWLGKRKPPTK